MISPQRPKDFNAKFEIGSCFLGRNGKFLSLLRQDHKPQGNTWGVPARKVEKGESPEIATVREMYEETGYKVKPEDLEFFKTVYVNFPEWDIVYHMYHYALSGDHGIQIDPKSHKDYRWVAPEEALSMPLIYGLDDCIRLFYKAKFITTRDLTLLRTAVARVSFFGLSA